MERYSFVKQTVMFHLICTVFQYLPLLPAVLLQAPLAVKLDGHHQGHPQALLAAVQAVLLPVPVEIQ